MERIVFEDYEDEQTTPLNAENLNKLQDNIEGAIDNATGRISAIETKDTEQDGRLDSLEANRPIWLGSSENLNDFLNNNRYYQEVNANASTSRNYPVKRAGHLECSYRGRIR